MKSSYYTGYKDLDERLGKLYGRQCNLEAIMRRKGIGLNTMDRESTLLRRQFRKVIGEQSALLLVGKDRDEAR